MWQQRWKRVGDSDSDSNGWTGWPGKGYNTRGVTYESTPPLPRRSPSSPTRSPPLQQREDHSPYYIYDYDVKPGFYGMMPPQAGYQVAKRFASPYRKRSLPGSVSEFSSSTYDGYRARMSWRIITLIVITIIILLAGITVSVYFGVKSSNKDQAPTTLTPSTTTSLPTTTAAEETVEIIVITGSLEMHNLTYTEALADPQTEEFQTLAAEVCSEFEAMFSNPTLADLAYDGCDVSSFRSGSVIADFTVNTTVNEDSASDNNDDSSIVDQASNSFSEALKDNIANGETFNGKGVIPDDITVEAELVITSVDTSSIDSSGDGEGDDLLDSSLFRA